MQCPRDGSALNSEKYEGDVVVDRCPSCHGFWLDSGELKSVQEIIEHDYSGQLNQINVVAQAYEFARQKTLPDIKCPKCGGDLNAKEYSYCSQILIDCCEDCGGMWLDAGELAALEKFFEQAAEEERQENVRRGFFASLWEHLR